MSSPTLFEQSLQSTDFTSHLLAMGGGQLVELFELLNHQTHQIARDHIIKTGDSLGLHPDPTHSHLKKRLFSLAPPAARKEYGACAIECDQSFLGRLFGWERVKVEDSCIATSLLYLNNRQKIAAEEISAARKRAFDWIASAEESGLLSGCVHRVERIVPFLWFWSHTVYEIDETQTLEKFLQLKGAELVDLYARTHLHLAEKNWSSWKVSALFQETASPVGELTMAQQQQLDQLLQQSIDVGNVEAALLFIQLGANVQSNSFPAGWDLLRSAIRHGSSELIETVLAKGAALSEGSWQLAQAHEGMKTLLKNHLRAHPSVSVDRRQEALFTNNQAELLSAIAQIDIDAIGEAILKGADPNIQDVDGRTALHQAILLLAVDGGTCEKIRLCKKLLRYGADPNIQDHKGITAVHLVQKMQRDAFKDACSWACVTAVWWLGAVLIASIIVFTILCTVPLPIFAAVFLLELAIFSLAISVGGGLFLISVLRDQDSLQLKRLVQLFHDVYGAEERVSHSGRLS